MKKLLFVFWLIITVNIGFSQSFKPFNFEKGVWYCKYITKGGMFGVYHGASYATDSVKYFCNGDTIINDLLYYKLFYVGYSSSQFVPSTYFEGYSGAIRNDTLNKKVYFIPHSYDVNYIGLENPLYNFDIGVGDTIGNSCYIPYEAITVSSIDSVLYCNEYHRFYNTSDEVGLIDGIGSRAGLFPLNCPLAIGSLICYQELENNECLDCNLFTSNLKKHTNNFNIYPNPTNDKIQIIPDKNIESVEIYDIHGKLIDEITDDFENIILRKNGIYIFRINSNNKIFIHKVVKY